MIEAKRLNNEFNAQNGSTSSTLEGRNRIRNCPNCGGKDLIYDPKHAELYCADCGFVIAENIVDLGPEWRAFNPEESCKKTRVGPPTTYQIYDMGLASSSIQFTFGPKTEQEEQLKTAQRRIDKRSPSEKTLDFALEEISRMTSALKLPENIKEAASMLYRKAMHKHLIVGQSIESVASALLYISCRQYGVPRTLKEIAEVSRVGEKEINRARKSLIKGLCLKVPPASPLDFVPRFCSLLGLNNQIRAQAIEIIKRTEEANLTNGRGPLGIAAAAIYIAAILDGKHRTQKDVANACGVTAVTVRNRYREISRKLKIEILLKEGDFAGRPRKHSGQE